MLRSFAAPARALLARTLCAIAILIAWPVAAGAETLLLRPDRVFDGEAMHEGWQVLVDGETIAAAGPDLATPAGTRTVDLPGTTLLPGLIEGHSHLFLHPYNETPWDEQVNTESDALRTVRAVANARATLMAGFTTMRDLGSEGAGYADAALAEAIEAGIVPGPRLLVATRALVATGAYGPQPRDPSQLAHRGAEEASGAQLVEAVRRQIGGGATVIKLYADGIWRPGEARRPTFTQAEIASAVEVAHTAGRTVAVHARTVEGMRNAVLAGVDTIEHGNVGTATEFALMAEHGTGFCPTLSIYHEIARYGGWDGSDPPPALVASTRNALMLAREAGVKICMGSDVGGFAHGNNALEMELMAQAGMPPIEVLRAATSVNAELFELVDRGRVASGLLADLIAVAGDPSQDIGAVRTIALVMRGGTIVRGP